MANNKKPCTGVLAEKACKTDKKSFHTWNLCFTLKKSPFFTLWLKLTMIWQILIGSVWFVEEIEKM